MSETEIRFAFCLWCLHSRKKEHFKFQFMCPYTSTCRFSYFGVVASSLVAAMWPLCIWNTNCAPLYLYAQVGLPQFRS